VHDGRFYFGTAAQPITTAAMNADSDGPGLAGSEGYKAVRARLAKLSGDAEPIGLMYADLPWSAMGMYQSYATILNTWNGFMRGFGGEELPDLNELLPPFNAIQPHLIPAGDILWADDKGLHYASVQPFPLATLLSPDAAISNGGGLPMLSPMWLFGMGISAALPAEARVVEAEWVEEAAVEEAVAEPAALDVIER